MILIFYVDNASSSTSGSCDELVCYVHCVSPVKQSGKTQYFDCVLQTQEKSVRGVCFSREKKSNFENVHKSKSPVKIRNFKLEEKRDGEINVLMDKKTKIDVQFPSDVKFERVDMPDPNEQIVISDIRSIMINQLVTGKGKLTSLSGKKKVNIGSQSLTKVTGYLVDLTGSIPITLWENFGESLEEGKTYIFKNLRVKTDYFTKEICVNTAKTGCTVNETDSFSEPLAELPILPSLGHTEKTSVIEIFGASSCVSYRTCRKCNKKVNVEGKGATCQSCKLLQKESVTRVNWIVKLSCEDKVSKEHIELSLFNEQVKQLFENRSDIDLNVCKPIDIKLAVLDFDDITVTYNLKDKTVISLSL